MERLSLGVTFFVFKHSGTFSPDDIEMEIIVYGDQKNEVGIEFIQEKNKLTFYIEDNLYFTNSFLSIFEK